MRTTGRPASFSVARVALFVSGLVLAASAAACSSDSNYGCGDANGGCTSRTGPITPAGHAIAKAVAFGQAELHGDAPLISRLTCSGSRVTWKTTSVPHSMVTVYDFSRAQGGWAVTLGVGNGRAEVHRHVFVSQANTGMCIAARPS